MERVCDELDEMRIEMEKLRVECRAKIELSERLRRAHAQQVAKVKEASLEIERHAQELNAKSEEISELRQLYEDLKSDLQKKNSFLQNLSSSHEKIRVDFGEKVLKLEGENRDTVIALDEATTRIRDLEKQVSASNEEINGLKRLLFVKQNKDPEEERTLQALKEREDMIFQLEEETRMVEDQLKWKSEQFKHLEEAHEKLRDHLQRSKVEMEQEKSALLEEILSLQASLDSQTRILESFQSQLKLCNQALAHEESRRKFLELELCEFQSRYENISSECEEAKAKIEHLTLKRDEELAELRNLVLAQEILCKEIKYRTAHLEEENQDLRGSVKELQEAQLNDVASTSSLRKLKNKLHSLEQLHGKCSINIKEKESEWSSQMEKLRGDLRCSIFEVKDKDKQIKELQRDLDCSLEAQNEEISILITVFKSELDVVFSKFLTTKADLESLDEESREEVTFQTERLDLKNREPIDFHADPVQRNERKSDLMELINFWDSMKEKQIFLEEEVQRYKEMLDESIKSNLRLEKHILEMENALEEQRILGSNDLQEVKFELASKTLEMKDTELDLQKLRSMAENLKVEIEEIRKADSDEKKDLIGIVKGQEMEIDNLWEQIALLESTVSRQTESANALKHENEGCMQIVHDRSITIENLHSEISQLKQANLELENLKLTSVEARRTFDQEKDDLLISLDEKDQRIKCLQEEAKSLEENMTKAVTSLTEKANMFKEALGRLENEKVLEIEDKNKIIRELDVELNDLLQKLERQEISFNESEDDMKQLRALLQQDKCEMEDLKIQFQNKLLSLEGRIEELKSQNDSLLEDNRQLSAYKDRLLLQIEGTSEQFSKCLREDAELSSMLEKIVSYSKNEPAFNHMGGRHGDDSPGRSIESCISVSRKGIQEKIGERAPLTELNC